MKLNLLACLVAVLLLAGCSGSMGGGGSAGSGSASVGGIAGSGSGSGSSDSSSGTSSIVSNHNPEPATVLLLGGGLVAYVLLRRKNRIK